MNKPEKLKQGMILAGVDICSGEYDKVIKWHNQACDKWEAYHKWYLRNLPSLRKMERQRLRGE